MSLPAEIAGYNENGSPRIHYTSDTGHVVLTGVEKGPITLADGTTYDLTPEVIEVAPGHGEQIRDLVNARNAEAANSQAQ